MEGIRVDQLGITKKLLRRRRILSHAELKAVWKAAGQLGVYGTLVRVLALTGQRVSEWAKARRTELIDDDGMQLLSIGGDRYKNGEGHELPITPKVRELLGTLPVFEGSPWLFSVTGRQHLNDLSRAKTRLDKASGVSGFCLHDIRRTMRTELGNLRVPYETAERTIGHSMGTLSQTYDLGNHRNAKMDALLAWEARLLSIVEQPPSPRGGLRLVEAA
jgi:integrase